MGDCACIYVDYETVETLDHRELCGRKEHRCGECKRAIPKGEKHTFTKYKWEGHLCTHRICADCQSIVDSFFCEGIGFGVVLEDLQTHIAEMHGDIDESCITPLTERAKNMVCAMMQEEIDEANAVEGEPTKCPPE